VRRHARISALAALGLCAAALAAAASASARADRTPMATVYTFQGRGWGHGVGMSQYGARGQALAGRGAGAILRHYYRGARLATAPSRTVKVLLAEGARSVAISSPRAWRALGGTAGGRRAVALPRRAALTLRVGRRGRLVLLRGARRLAAFTGAVRLASRGQGGSIAWGEGAPRADQRYRGALRAVPSDGGFDLVNAVGLEDYLKGVVPREMPPDWGDDAPAALAVQAVAARSYALATLDPTAAYDLYDDDRSQTYGGVATEDPRSTRAVEATRNTVLTYGGEVITAYFFSTSGGRTENVENVFRDHPPRPYLVSVPDPYDRGSPYHASWPDPPSFTAAGLGRALGLDGPVARVELLRRGVSPRVLDARLTTRSGRRTVVSGIALRSSLGLRDTWFRVVVRKMPRDAAARLVGAT
jgi:stage II sporulation protein D